jgi:hypothetical protein
VVTKLAHVLSRAKISPQCSRDLHQHAIDACQQQEEGEVSPAIHSFEIMTDDNRPQGNDSYVRSAPSNPKETRWHYDDDVRVTWFDFTDRSESVAACMI